MRFDRVIIATILVNFAISVPVAWAESALMAGNSDRVWLVLVNDSQNSHDVLTKPLDQKQWDWKGSSFSGRPSAAIATGEQLQLTLKDPLGYLSYDVQRSRPIIGKTPETEHWPADAAVRLGLLDTQAQAELLAIVSREAGKAGQMKLGLFRKTGDHWQYVNDVPDDVPLIRTNRFFVASQERQLLLLVQNGQQAYLWSYDGHHWTWHGAFSDWPLAAQAVGMVTIENQTTIVLDVLKDEGHVLELASLDSQNQSLTIHPILLQDKPLSLPNTATPQASQLGDRIALLWKEKDQWQWGTTDQNGFMLPPSSVLSDARPLSDARGEDLLNKFSWGLMLAILVPLFFLRPQTPPKPFSLPPYLRSASPFKRILAGAIDLFLCGAAVRMVFRFQPYTFGELRDMAQHGQIPSEIAYAIIAMLVLYTVYGVVLEKKFGATLGKMALKLRITGDEGIKPGWREILLRNFVRNIELLWPFGVILITVLLFVTKNHQRLGDLMARTTVVERKLRKNFITFQVEETSTEEDGENPPPRK